jgi:hypothetical protein
MPAPVCSANPAITGTATVGSTLTGTNGTWTGLEPTKRVFLPPNTLRADADFLTVARTGAQGDRELTATLVSASGAKLDSTRKVAHFPLYDAVAPGTEWWKNLGTLRSGKTDGHRCGTSYYNDTSECDYYERQVCYADIFNGKMPEDKTGTNPGADTVLTMNRALGAPDNNVLHTENDNIGDISQYNWNKGSNQWTMPWQHYPKGVVCVLSWWSMAKDYHTNIQPVTKANKNHYGNSKIWDEIVNGDWKNDYISSGRRIWKAIQTKNPKGHDLDHVIFRMDHENNQSNEYQIWLDSYKQYQKAQNLIIEYIRTGIERAGGHGSDLKFFWAPAVGTHSVGGLGRYKTACPSDVDGYSISWHPDDNVKDKASAEAYNNENLKIADFHLQEMVNVAEKDNMPMICPEWSPREDQCTGANYVVNDFDTIMSLVSNNLYIGDCLFTTALLSETGFEGTSTVGKANWKLASQDYKRLWGGTKRPPP